MKVSFSEAAEADLENIGDYIASDNTRRAITFVQELRTAAMSIGDYAEAFPLIPQYERHGVRRRPYGNYLIFYAIEADNVVIVHIAHSAEDYLAVLFPDA